MPLMNPYWVLLSNLAGRIDADRLDHLRPEVARERLAAIAGIDFGHDLSAWNQWLIQDGRLGEDEFQVVQSSTTETQSGISQDKNHGDTR